MTNKEDTQKKMGKIEEFMNSADFWVDKDKAQRTLREYESLKAELAGEGKYDKGDAVMTLFSGAGGDDSEDFSKMLLEMYKKFFDKKGWRYSVVHKNENDHGGYRNITLEINGKSAYGTLKYESGVHRLVRISPFNANQKRHTSFSMVEVIPKFEKSDEVKIPEDEIKTELSRSSGAGGQNVNKRETAVRLVHIPTNLAVHVESERSQAQNKEKALHLLEAKLYKMQEEERQAKEKGLYVSKTTQVEWGNQIRSYVLHPYKMVKDHRTNVEVHDVEKVLDGGIEEFLEAEKWL